MAKKNRKVKIGSDRYEDSYKEKDKGGSGGKKWLEFAEKVKYYEPKEGVNRVNIIPYEIKTKNHPRVKAGKAKIGDYDYNLDVFVHRYVGPGNADVLCPKRTYGKTCPICEECSKFYDNGQEKEGKALLPSRRVVYNVEPVIKGESQGIQLFDVSHFLFEKELIEEAHACVDGADIIEFADLDDGKLVKFRAVEETFGKNKYFEFKNFSFEDRDEELDDEIIEGAISLDEGLVVLSYEEIEKVFFGAPDDDDEPINKKDDDDERPPRPEKNKRQVDDDDDGPVRNKRGDDEKPKKKPVEEDPFNDDDVPGDEPPAKGKKDKCPHGYKYGKDTDEYKECKKCKLWDACMEGK